MNWYLRVLKKYATFEGRARRKEFWYFKLFHNLIIYAFLLYGIYAVLSDPSLDKNAGFFEIFPKIFSPLLIFYLIVTFIPNLAVSVRRLHDINRSSEYILLWFIAPVGPVVLFVFLAMPGNPGDNKFGPNPIITPDPAPMSAAQKRRQRMAANRTTPSHPYPPRSRRPTDRKPPLQRQRRREYGDDDTSPDHQRPRRTHAHAPTETQAVQRGAMYKLDHPISNEGERYQDPFATHLSSGESVVDEHLKRFGVIVDTPDEKEKLPASQEAAEIKPHDQKLDTSR